MEKHAAFVGVDAPDLNDVDQLLKEGDVLRWGMFEAQALHTPGHTPGSVSLYLPHDAGKITVPKKSEKADAPETSEKISLPAPPLLSATPPFPLSLTHTSPCTPSP